MKNLTTTFNPIDYQTYDRVAKQKVINWINNRVTTFVAEENPDQYGIDILIYQLKPNKDGSVEKILHSGCECEVKRMFTDDLRVNKVHIPYRKQKFFKHSNLRFTFFAMLNINLDKMFWIHSDKILNGEIISKITYRGTDTFFEVDKSEFKLVDL